MPKKPGKRALNEEGAMLEAVAPMVGGVEARDGSWIEADQRIDGAPSVLYDAVALLISERGARALASEPAARDFVADAFAHQKLIAYVSAAAPLLEKAGAWSDGDEGLIQLKSPADASTFVRACRKLRVWQREPKLRLAA